MKQEKTVKQIPRLTLLDEETGYSKVYIPRGYVLTMLQGLQIVSLHEPAQMAEEFQRLNTELVRAED